MEMNETVFIGHYSVDRPYARKIQIILERKGYRTFFMDLATLEELQNSSSSDVETYADLFRKETRNSGLTHIFEIQSSVFHRWINITQTSRYALLDEYINSPLPDVVTINIDECFKFTDMGQFDFLESSLDVALSGKVKHVNDMYGDKIERIKNRSQVANNPFEKFAAFIQNKIEGIQYSFNNQLSREDTVHLIFSDKIVDLLNNINSYEDSVDYEYEILSLLVSSGGWADKAMSWKIANNIIELSPLQLSRVKHVR